MATPAQIAASHANGQLSKGPTSAEGKAVSSRNALKLGISAQSMIIPGEDPAELDHLTAEYEEHFLPVGPVEAALVQTIVRAQWMQRRCDRIEAQFLNSRVAALEGQTAHPLGAAVAQDSEKGNTLQKIFRRRQAAQRDWYTAVEALTQLQAQRHRAEEKAATRAAHPSSPSRVRFDSPQQPIDRPVPEPPANLALRL